MAKLFGKDYRLWLESATAGTYNMVKGQGDLKRSDGVDNIDTSDKDTFPYKTQAPGARTTSFSLDMKIDLPDATGYSRLETLTAGSTPFNIQLRKGGAAGASGDVVFQGSVYAVISDRSYPADGVVTCTVSFTLAAAPVTDAMA